MADAAIKTGVFGDAVVLGLRAILGVSFIVHGFSKFGNPEFVGWMSTFGIGPEGAFIIAIGEFIPGIFLILGVLSRISASIIAIILMSILIIIKGLEAFTGDNGYEYDLVLLAAALVVIVIGPARFSIAHVIGRLPRFIH